MKKHLSIFLVLITCGIFMTTAFAEDSNDNGEHIPELNEITYTLNIGNQSVGLNSEKEIDLDIWASDGVDTWEISIPFAECAFKSYNEDILTIDNKGIMSSKNTEGIAEIEVCVNGNNDTIKVIVSNNPNELDIELYIAEFFLRNSEIMIGDENGNFNAENAMTRAEFAKIVCKFTNREQAYKGYGCDYTDVATDFWGYNYIMNATQAGYLRGYGNRVFGVNDTLTEEQAITVLCRMLGDTYEDVSYIETSVDENGGYSEGYISIAGKRGIDIEGLQKTVPATRARVAKWLYQLYNIKNNF